MSMYDKLPGRYHWLARSMRESLLAKVLSHGSKRNRYAVMYGASWERLCRGKHE